MALFSAIVEKIKEIFKGMLSPNSVEQVLHITPAISGEMADRIQLWEDMYENHAPWLVNDNEGAWVKSLNLASYIASEKARTALLEFETEITCPTIEVEKPNPDYKEPTVDEFGNITHDGSTPTITEDVPVSDTARAEYMNRQYAKVKRKIRTQLEYGIAKGGFVIKPYVVIPQTDPSAVQVNNIKVEDNTEDVNQAVQNSDKYQIEFDYVQATGFYPMSFNDDGKVTEASFVQRKISGAIVYSRLEYHKLVGNTVTIVNRAFKAKYDSNVNLRADTDLGEEIPLTEVSDWANIAPIATIGNVDRLLFAYFRMPDANTIDPYSPLGVSGFDRAVDLIRDADMQYSRLLWEFEGGELAVDVDRDALRFEGRGNEGHTVLPRLQERLFRRVDITGDDMYSVFSPQLRDESLINGLNKILAQIEDRVGLSRGTISEVTTEAKTATELRILKSRTYSANQEIQNELKHTLEDVVYIMNVFCTLYEIVPEGQYDVSFEFDDSILTDTDTELTKMMTLYHEGILGKDEVRMWYKGETERQARQALQRIDRERQAEMREEAQIYGWRSPDNYGSMADHRYNGTHNTPLGTNLGQVRKPRDMQSEFNK